MFYLTNVDEELTASGGSRDPLGLQPVWSFFGRELVPSLTTVSTRSHHFSRLLVALSCRDAWLAVHPDTELRGADSLVVFEELHAYSLRAEHTDIGDTPGKRRVEANHDHDPEIGPGPKQQILRNQAGVGISGRYFTPLVRMAIVDKEGRLSNEVQLEDLFGPEVVKLQQDVCRVFAMLEETGEPVAFSDFPKTARRRLTSILPRDGHVSAEEVAFWRNRIGIDGDSWPLVRRAAHHLRRLPEDTGDLPRAVVHALLNDDLAAKERKAVEAVRACEEFIAPLQKLFDQLYQSDGLPRFEDSPKAHAWRQQLRQARDGFTALRVKGDQLARRFRSLTEIEVDGTTEAFVRTLLHHHEGVAADKGGTPWIGLEGSKVHALNPAYEPWDWSDADESAWVNGYYLPSLRSVLGGLDREISR